MLNRRQFVKSAIAASGAVLGVATASASAPRAASRKRAKLDILILGGTGFIGPYLVRYAVQRGHRVTIFTRGVHDAPLPADVKRLVGDRNGQLGALEGKRWNAVIDDSATNPDWVRLSAQLLKDAAGQYMFTSSTGVYYPYLKRGLDESVAPRLDADDPKDGSAKYGVDKTKCERETRAAFGDRAIVVRPTYIVGPGDTTDRFPYWPVRLARGGDVLAPGRPDDPVQFIDVRDLTEWMIHLLEDQRSGTYNAAGPKSTMTAPVFLEEARRALSAPATLVHVDDYTFLADHRITSAIPWAMLRGNNEGMMSIDNSRAVGSGLTFRPVADTVRDTLAWWPSVPSDRQAHPHFAITPEQEARALADWKALGR